MVSLEYEQKRKNDRQSERKKGNDRQIDSPTCLLSSRSRSRVLNSSSNRNRVGRKKEGRAGSLQ
jgi:hypothetical protein